MWSRGQVVPVSLMRSRNGSLQPERREETPGRHWKPKGCSTQAYERRSSLALFAGLLTFFVGINPGWTHTHVGSDGKQVSWYPFECCHGRDCRPVATIKSAPNGLWMTTVDGLTVLVGPGNRRRPSLDNRWHICIGPGEMDDAGPQIFCIFEPPNS